MNEQRDGRIKSDDSMREVNVRDLAISDTVHVRTLYSDYRLLLLNPALGRVIVRGGRFFPGPGKSGADWVLHGDCVLKNGLIALGLRMELIAGGQCVITSPVQSLWIERRTLTAEPQAEAASLSMNE